MRPRRGGVAASLLCAVLGALLLVATGCGWSAAGSGAGRGPVDLGFQATTADGASFDGQRLAGKPAVLWFWAPWCPTCHAQTPAVSDLAETYDGRVNVVGVGGLDDAAAIRDYADNVGDDVTVLVDADGTVWQHFGVTAQSTYVVLDADGRVAAAGYLTDAELAEHVADLAG